MGAATSTEAEIAYDANLMDVIDVKVKQDKLQWRCEDSCELGRPATDEIQ